MACPGAIIVGFAGIYWKEKLVQVGWRIQSELAAFGELATVMVLLGAVLAIDLVSRCLGKNVRAVLGLRHFFRYPPGWLASLVGAGSVFVIWG